MYIFPKLLWKNHRGLIRKQILFLSFGSLGSNGQVATGFQRLLVEFSQNQEIVHSS